MLIVLQKVTKKYVMGIDEIFALKEINFQVAKGEFVSIMGPSGSGKSTLMNILGCLDTPSTGKYYLAGKEVSYLSDNELARIRNQHIGFVFQNFNLLPKISTLQNVMLPMVYAKIPKIKREFKAMEALKMVGLEDRYTHKSNELSGGQRQRVAIARALVNEPDLILADEPTGNLDSSSGAEIMKIFKKLHQKGKTILLVTHEKEVAENANRVIFVRDGKIVSDK